jgi:hypothetical protein
MIALGLNPRPLQEAGTARPSKGKRSIVNATKDGATGLVAILHDGTRVIEGKRDA